MFLCGKSLQHPHKLQKRYDNNYAKPQSYALGNKVWLKSKYIQNKQNRKFEIQFIRSFQAVDLVKKQAHKLKVPKR